MESCSNLETDIKIKNSDNNHYNENLYFNGVIDRKGSQISQIIEEIIQSKNKPPIKFNFHISNNYYNSEIKVQEHKKEEKSKFFSFLDILKNIFGFKKNDNYHEVKSDNNNRSNEFFYVPCLNCGDEIHIDDVTDHSQFCLYVKEEVLNLDKYDPFKAIDYKLKKIKDHLNNLIDEEEKCHNNHSKDIHYLTTLFNYVSNSMEIKTINKKTISSLKKIGMNLFTLSNLFKGNPYTLILIERTKVLLKEKIKKTKELFKKDHIETKAEYQLNEEIKKKINELNSKKETMLKENNKIRLEKDFLLRKISNFKHSLENNHITTTDEDYFDDSSHNNVSLFKEKLTKPFLEDINSEVDKYQSEKSHNTSFDSISENNIVSVINNSSFIEETFNKEYKEFVNIFLQIKFSLGKLGIHNIEYKSLWEEVNKNNIPKEKWRTFIQNKIQEIKPRQTKGKPSCLWDKMKTIKEESI